MEIGTFSTDSARRVALPVISWSEVIPDGRSDSSWDSATFAIDDAESMSTNVKRAILKPLIADAIFPLAVLNCEPKSAISGLFSRLALAGFLYLDGGLIGACLIVDNYNEIAIQ
jgi:hypothetical protein